MKKNFKDWSRENWVLAEGNVDPSNEQLILGCLQRIADASEVTAKNHQNLMNERDRYEKWYREERERKEALERSMRTLKGNYTRLKNKLETLQEKEKQV